jgi:hypothetical protein
MKRMAAGVSSSRGQCHGAAGNCISECGSEEGTRTGDWGRHPLTRRSSVRARRPTVGTARANGSG